MENLLFLGVPILKHIRVNDLRKNICLRKSEVSVEIISVCNVTEKIWQSTA